MRPESGASTPSTRLNSVVLPAPFGPSTPRMSPSATERLSPSMTLSAPKRRLSSTSSSIQPPFFASAPRSGVVDHRRGAADRNIGIERIIDDRDVIGIFLALGPLADDKRGQAAIRQRPGGEIDRPDDRV